MLPISYTKKFRQMYLENRRAHLRIHMERIGPAGLNVQGLRDLELDKIKDDNIRQQIMDQADFVFNNAVNAQVQAYNIENNLPLLASEGEKIIECMKHDKLLIESGKLTAQVYENFILALKPYVEEGIESSLVDAQSAKRAMEAAGDAHKIFYTLLWRKYMGVDPNTNDFSLFCTRSCDSFQSRNIWFCHDAIYFYTLGGSILFFLFLIGLFIYYRRKK